MHSTLSVPTELAPPARTRVILPRFTGLHALACLLVTLLSSVIPGFAQTWVADLTGTNLPTFVALDANRTIGATTATWLYVSEHGDTSGSPPGNGGRILRYNLTSGGAPTVVAPRGTADGEFISPDAILIDSATGDLFVSDRYLHRVQRLTNTGTFVMKFGRNVVSDPQEMWGPLGLARDAAGAIYVGEHGDGPAGTGGNFVSKYTISGTTATRVWRQGGPGSGNGQFSTPYGVAVTGGDLFISDGFNARVQRWDLNGTYQSQFSVGSGVIPLGLFIDSSGALWVAESNSDYSNGGVNQVNRRTTAGVESGMKFGVYGTGNGQFRLPFHVVTNPATNRAYVADYANSRIQVWDLAATPPTDTTAPTVSSFTLGTNTTTSVNFALTFSEAVTGVTADDFTVTLAGGATGTVATPTGSGTSWTVPVTFGGTAGGTIRLTLKSTGTGITDAATNAYAGGGTAQSATFTVPSSGGGDTTAPTVSSFTFQTATSTNGTFQIVFSETVTGVTVDDFYGVSTGNTTATLSGVSGSGTTYAVAFDYVGNTGALQLRIRATGTGITDAASNAFAGGGTLASDVVQNSSSTGDTAGPVVSSFAAGAASGGSVAFTITFDEPVNGVGAGVFTTTGGGSSIASVLPTGTAGTTYVATVNYSGSSGTITLALNSAQYASIRDFNNNPYAGGGTNSANATISGGGGSAPAIVNQTATGTQNAAFNYQVVATGATSFAVFGSPALPAGLTMSTSGAVTGTPTATSTTTVTVRATNASGSTDATVTITISAPTGTAPTIANQTATGTQNVAFNYQVVATGATSFAVFGSPALPAGLTMSTSGAITGTPTATGTTAVTVRATNANGSTNATLTMTISAPAGTAPTIASQTATGTQNAAFNYQVVATGATSFSIVGTPALPAGLTMSTSGAITGTPTATGTTAVTVRATNANGSTNATLTITISAPAGTAPTIANQTANGTQNAAFNFQVVATGATSFSIVGTPALPAGLTMSTSGAITGTPTAAGTTAVTVRATNAIGSTNATLTITVAAATPTAPSIANQSTSVFVDQAMSYQVAATGATSFAVVGTPALPAGLSLSTTGRITGTPTTTGTMAVTIRATNSAGSADATVTIAIQAVPPPPPPPPAPVQQGQIITFNSPASGVTIFQPINLGATTTSGLPITYSIVTGSATLTGNTLTPQSAASLVIRAAQAGSSSYAPASLDVSFGTPAKAAQIITFPNVGTKLTKDGTVTLAATTNSGLPITYTLVSGPAALNGSVVTLNGGSGTVVLRSSQAGSDTYAAATTVTMSFAVRAVGPQVYFGNIGPDAFALSMMPDNARGILVTRLSSNGAGVVLRFRLNPDNTFSGVAEVSLPASASPSDSGVPATAAAAQPLTFTGSIVNGVLTGKIVETNTTFTANVQPAVGSTASTAGLYDANLLGSASGTTYLVVGPTGQVFVLTVSPSAVTSGTGTISTTGAFTVATSSGTTVTGTISPGDGKLFGKVTAAGVTQDFAGLAAGTEHSDRLINVSSRLRVTGGDASKTVVVGFFINGSAPKQILVRAVGPGLQGYGIKDALAAPNLRLFNSAGVVVAENAGWNNSSDISSTSTRVGAFALGNGSKDSALVVTLPSGAYTAQVDGINGNGIALIEVYDATTGAQISGQQIVNLSSRGWVGTDDEALLAGFVVTGNAPKRVLIRGIGPTLARYGVTSVIANPVLKVYASGNPVAIAQNDNWGTPQAVGATQTAASAVELTSAFMATGAFPLDAGSQDAAVILTLMPGAYSAVVTGSAGTTGAGMVEVYEIPNP